MSQIQRRDRFVDKTEISNVYHFQVGRFENIPDHCETETVEGAPGDAWTCPYCGTNWVAREAGPLDIKWIVARD